MVRSLLSRFTLGWYDHYLLHRWLRQQSVTARTCRATVEVAGQTRHYRLAYVGLHKEINAGEDASEMQVKEWLNGLGSAELKEARWTRCHFVLHESWASESETIQLLVHQLHRNNSRYLFTVQETHASLSDSTAKQTASPLTSA